MAQALQMLSLRGLAASVGTVSPELAFAVRFAASASAAIWLGHAPGLVTNESSWILITVLMVAQPNSGGSLFKGLLRGAGTAVAAVVSVVLFGWFSQDPPLLLASFFLVQAVGAYGFSGPRHQYAWFVFAFTTAIILGESLSGTQDVVTLAFQRATMVGLGILIVVIVDALLWPIRAEPIVRAGLAARARVLGTALREAITLPVAAPTEAAAVLSSPLVGQLGQIETARTEIGVSTSRAEILQHVVILLEAVASRVRILGQPLQVGDAPTGSNDSLTRALRAFAGGVEAALEEVAAALEANRVPAPFADRLERAFLPIESELARLRERGTTRAEVEGRAASLRDLVALLSTLQRAFDRPADLVADSGAGLTPARITESLRPDPFRMQIALRAGIAVCVAFVLPMTLGWSVNILVGPIAFMVAAIPTRGGVTQTVLGLVAVVGLGWLLADLAIVFVGPQLSRLPLALLHVTALGCALAYVSAKRPELASFRTIGLLLALLPVYGGPSAPTDVYGPYSTACYMAVALAIGWATTQLLWPATAATLFREQAAAQLDLCLSTLRGFVPDSDAARRRRRADEVLQRYTRQLAQIGTLHRQAELEPAELCLDGSQRAALLALTQDLFDASLATQGVGAWEGDPIPGPHLPEHASLRDDLLREQRALFASVQSAADTLRGHAGAPGSELVEAQRAVLGRLDGLRDETVGRPTDRGPARAIFLEQLDLRRQIVTRQLALEAWLADWGDRESAHP